MQKLTFNTTKKTVEVIVEGVQEFYFENVPTVKVADGYYEVLQTGDDDRTTPVLRVPINQTNMVIER